MTMRFVQVATIALALTCMFSGCDAKPTASGGTAMSASDSHADHGHGDEGPHGGHWLHLEPNGVHAEWTHDDDAKSVTVYLDNLDAAKVKSVAFSVKVGEAAPQEFALAKGQQSWAIVSEELMTHLNMGKAAAVSLVIDTEAGPLNTQIEHTAHEHHHH